jgi:hypothetical protein
MVQQSVDKQCGSCKYWKQGNSGCFCGNPKQENEQVRQYSYYFFSCELYSYGTDVDRINKKIYSLKNRIQELELLKTK